MSAASSSSPAAEDRVWFVTGSSSGLGRALCERLLERGASVFCTARDVSKVAGLEAAYPGKAMPLRLDVTDPASITQAIATALAAAGRIDVLVNNAGYGLVGALEEAGERAVVDAFDANVYGPYRVIRAALPHMRERGRGHILNISSMAGVTGAPGFTFYSATKFALEGMSEALAAEVAPFGIKVTLIEPGPFRTNFRGSNMVSVPPMEVYAPTVGKFRQMLADTDGKQPGDPRRAADAMISAVNAENPPLRLPLGEICVQQVRNKLAKTAEELERWLPVSLATSYE